MRYEVKTIPGVRCQCYGVWDNQSDSWVWNPLPGAPAKATKENAEYIRRTFFPEDSIPAPVSSPSWDRVKDSAAEIVSVVCGTGRPPKDFKHYLFEEVMTTVYGDDFWGWWRDNANY